MVAERMLIRFHPIDPSRIEWIRLSPRKGTNGGAIGCCTLEEFMRQPGRRECRATLLAPASELLLTSVQVAGRNGNILDQALPYALEDQLARDVDTLYFARGPRKTDGSIPVAVIDRGRLDSWLKYLRDAGLEIEYILPECLLLPLQDNAWSCLSEPDRTLVRTGEFEGFAIENDALPSILQAHLSEGEEPPERLRYWNASGSETIAEALTLSGWRIESETLDGMPLELLAKNLISAPKLNLLQGACYHRNSTGHSFRSWFPALVLLLLALVAHIGFSTYEYLQLSRQSQVATKSVQKLFRATFPEVKRVVDMAVQAEQQLTELRRSQGQGSDTFLYLLSTVGKAIHIQPKLQLTQLSFQNKVLQVHLSGEELGVFEKFKQALAGQGMSVEILSAVVREEMVQGRIRIGMGGS